jgi:Tol biopolymer transport system component
MVAGALNVWIRNADGNVQPLTTSATASAISMVPAWTADGRRVVFESNRAVPPAESTPNDPYDVSAQDGRNSSSRYWTAGRLSRVQAYMCAAPHCEHTTSRAATS